MSWAADADRWASGLPGARQLNFRGGKAPWAASVLYPVTGPVTAVIAPYRARLRLAGLAALAVAGAATAAAVGLAAKGYADHPASYFEGRLGQVRQSGLYDSEGLLIGSIGDPKSGLPVDEQRKHAFVPLSAEALPDIFKKGLLYLEDRGFGSFWRICGIPWSTALRVVGSGGVAGGSGLVQQHARGLKPSWGNEVTLIAKALRKSAEWGTSCGLVDHFADKGGYEALLKSFASAVPMWQGNGSLRGIEAAAAVTFGKKVNQLSDAEQLLFAAAIRLPLRVLQVGDLAVPCERVWPRDGAAYDGAVASAHPARQVQCRVIRRAMHAAEGVLQGPALVGALAELRRFEKEGIHPVDQLQPIEANKLINLTGRRLAALPPTATALLVREANALADFEWGQPLALQLDIQRQVAFAGRFKQALEIVQQRRDRLCIPLIAGSSTSGFSPLCGSQAAPEGTAADFLAISLGLENGALQTVAASTPAVLRNPTQLASIAKWVVAYAAIMAGWTPETLLCPRQRRDGVRQLRRVGSNAFGVRECTAKNAVTLRDAIARSDNLAIANAADRLGEAALVQAMADLGLPKHPGDLAYALAFGTATGTPVDMLTMARRLFGAAYGIALTNEAAPVVLGGHHQPNADPLHLTGAQSLALRQLLEAPVQQGTLKFAQKFITAGKTGTASSEARDRNGRRAVAAKLAITFNKAQNEVALLIVTAPKSSVPLGLHPLSAADLGPLHQALHQPARK